MPSTIGSKVVAKVADADLSAYKNRFVTFTNTGCALATAGSKAHGILLNAPTQGQVAEIAIESGKVKLTGSVSAGGSIEVGANGVAVPASGTNTSVGQSEINGASGDLIPVILDLHK